MISMIFSTTFDFVSIPIFEAFFWQVLCTASVEFGNGIFWHDVVDEHSTNCGIYELIPFFGSVTWQS